MKSRGVHSAAKISAAILAALPALIQQWLPIGDQRGEVYFALNPRRKDHKLGSFQINTRTGRWRDHAIDIGGGNATSLYAYLFTGGDLRTAVKELADQPNVRAAIVAGPIAPPANAAKLLRSPAKLARVATEYGRGVSLASMPAAAYLKSRSLRPTDAWDGLRASVMRYPGRGHHAVLLAPIEGLDGSLVGLHRTYLTPAGTKLDVTEPRLTLGYPRGGAIRLGSRP